MSARWWTLLVWALAAAGALFWGLKLFVKAPAAPAHTQLAQAGAAASGDLSRLLGADPEAALPAAAAEPLPDARFQLVGVVSPRSAAATREGVALIAVDGKSPRAYRVGAVVDGQNVLQSVNARGATLGPRGGAALVALTLPPPAPAATGVPGQSGSLPPPLVRPAPMPPMPGAQPSAVPQLQPQVVPPVGTPPTATRRMMPPVNPPPVVMPAQPQHAQPPDGESDDPPPAGVPAQQQR